MSSAILTIATEWSGASNETVKTEVPCHNKVGHNKNPICSTVLNFVALVRWW